MSSGEGHPPAGPPYPPTTAALGGRPTVNPDVIVSSILLAFYVGTAAWNMFLFRMNIARGHYFPISAALFGFSMARILTLCLRIGSATRPKDIPLAIAANIFLNAGILVVYVVNLVLALRILRARQPKIGWHAAVRAASYFLYVLVAGALVIVISCVVYSFYTLDEHVKWQTRQGQLAAITYLLVFTLVPWMILAFTYIRKPEVEGPTFGEGSMRSKAIIIAVSTALCVTNSGYKTGVNWMPPRPANNPGWYQTKGAFYPFIFVIELFILGLFLITRIDKRFYVPDGSRKVKNYRSSPAAGERPSDELPQLQARSQETLPGSRPPTTHTGTTKAESEAEKEGEEQV